MFSKILANLVDFVQMLYKPEAVFARHRKTPRGLNAPRSDWSYPR